MGGQQIAMFGLIASMAIPLILLSMMFIAAKRKKSS
ncbi:PEP-CTERM protein-sorting domain-containing protein [Aneurinibacillus thermoaerophilus]|jgi:hypothetical protein|uniref:PEP-CTERM protein-sorting domain-containing protein n=1 Tax=Aneurinibacillus thermoaerophilus TaxID=143495 RepID=A0A1G7YKM6_ANETH|nr:PEP-CTERM protein-sorting domain-containing protein [Aneurinibacillus thermoaerophilus]